MRAAPTRSGCCRATAMVIMALFAVACASAGPGPETRTDATAPVVVGRPGALASATASSQPQPVRSSEGVAPEQLARASLDAYVDGLTSQTFGRAMAASTGAARRLALVRLVLAEHNRIRGGSTTVELVERRLDVAAVRGNRITFRGAAVLRSTVVGADGVASPASERRISDPVVVRAGSDWLVSGFSWEGRPIVANEGGQTLSLHGVEFRLEGSIVFGDVIGIVVLLVADGTRSVQVDADRLRVGDVEAPSGFRTLIGGQPGVLYMTYPRKEAPPRSWRANVVIDDGGSAEVMLAF